MMVLATATLFVLRLSRSVNPAIFEPAEVVNSWETDPAQFPGLNAPAHVAHVYELNVWVNRPNTLRGIISDFNEQWPGLRIGIVSSKRQGGHVKTARPLPEPCLTCGRLLCGEEVAHAGQ